MFGKTLFCGSGNFYDLAGSYSTTGVVGGAYGTFDMRPFGDVRAIRVVTLVAADQRWGYFTESGTGAFTFIATGITPGSYTARNVVQVPIWNTTTPAYDIHFNNPRQPITFIQVQNVSALTLSGTIYAYSACPRYNLG